MMLLCLLLVCISCTACASCCDSRVESEEPSPSGRMIAKVTYQNCGALRAGTSVSLRASKRHWWSKDGLVVGASGRHAITVLWKDERHWESICRCRFASETSLIRRLHAETTT